MAYANAEDDRVLYVQTSIGNESKNFKCKSIEKTPDGFILKSVVGYEYDVHIINAPVLIRYDLPKGMGARSIKL